MRCQTGGVPEVWQVEERTAAASVLHQSWPAAESCPDGRRIAVCRPTGDAVVLGSTQSPDVVDADAAASAGVAVVRRRSGGGAVLVTAEDPVWVDLWVPVGDARWSADVAVAFAWLGAAWARALGRLGVAAVEVQGPAPGDCTRWASLVCFGGVGAGEVSVGGRKVVGLAQRRNRNGAWFHTACVRHWDPNPLLDLLDLSPGERAVAYDGLGAAATGVCDALGSSAPGGGTAPDGVAAALLDELASS